MKIGKDTIRKLLGCFILVQCSLILTAANYYVSPQGLDTNNGSFSNPFFSIQHGSNQLIAGDSLFVMGGSYFENVFLNGSGTEGNPITILAYEDEIPIIDGAGTTSPELFVISSKSHVTLDGIIFQNKYIQNAKGIYIPGEGKNIVIKNCEIRNIGWTSDSTADPYSVTPTGQAHGLLVNGRTTEGISELIITDCSIHDIITGNSEALTLVGNNSNFEISHVEVYDTKNIGIDIAGHYAWAIDSGVDPTLNQSRNGSVHHCIVHGNKRNTNVDAPAGIYADGSRDVSFYSNTVYDNGNGFSIGCENTGFTASNIIVVNNLIYDNDNQGIYFGSNASDINDCVLKNNTFLANGKLGVFYSEISLQNSSDCLISQNILVPNGSSNYAVSIFGYAVSNLTVDNNLAYRYNGDFTNLFIPGSPAQFAQTNTINEDPLFMDPSIASLDINLSSSSPAIDQGIINYPTYISEDIFDNFRITNGKLDLGAAEAVEGDCPEVLIIDDDLSLSGSFVAQDTIVLDIELSILSEDIILSSDILKIVRMTTDGGQATIRGEGCTD